MVLYVSRISLRNVRSFGDLDLDLTREPRAGSTTPRLHTVLIGENGTGKSTLLRAIAVGLADAKDTSGLLAEEATGQFVAEGAPEATIEIELLESETQEKSKRTTVIRTENSQDVLESKDPDTLAPVGLVCGYGVGRAMEGSDTGRAYRVVDSVYTLFNYTEALTGTELALRRLDDFLGSEWYPPVMKSIKAALGLDSAVDIVLVKGGGVRVSGPGIGKNISLEGWADGYRKTLAWILNIYVWAMRAECITPTGDVTGIVLLDEMEQHLHPSMQVGISSRLNTLLPHVQIIATTHSPFVALGVEPDELVVLKRDGDKVLAYESVPDFHGYSVEDMVADPLLFDSDIYKPDLKKKLDEYRALAGKPPAERSADQQSKLQELGSELMALQVAEFRGSPALAELQRILKKHNL